MSSSSYTICSGCPTKSLYEQIRVLNQLDTDTLTDLAVHCLEEKSSKLEVNGGLTEAACMQYNMSPHMTKSAVAALQYIITGAESRSPSADAIRHDLVRLGLNEEKAASLVSLITKQSREDNPVDVFLSNSTGQLVDMEWKFGVTAASSELDRVGATFVQLKMSVVNTDRRTENIYLELSLAQFYNFLHELEKAKAKLDFLT